MDEATLQLLGRLAVDLDGGKLRDCFATRRSATQEMTDQPSREGDVSGVIPPGEERP